MKFIEIDNDTHLELARVKLAKDLFVLIDSNRTDLSKWLPWTPFNKSPDDTRMFLEKNVDRYQKEKSGAFAIYYKGKLAGLVDLHKIDKTHKKSSIGYWLDKNHQGKGLMTKAVEAVLKYAFEVLNLHRIEISAATGNKKSQGVPVRLGFTKEGIQRDGNHIQGIGYLDMIVYSKLKTD